MLSSCIQTHSRSENRQKYAIFKERFLPLKVILSLSSRFNFKANDLFFSKVLFKHKSKLHVSVHYSLQESTDCEDCRFFLMRLLIWIKKFSFMY